MRLVDQAQVKSCEDDLREESNYRSNDPHIIALAQASGARLLYSNDKKLQENFKDTKLVIVFVGIIKGRVEVSPTYDLTFSHGPGGEQNTMVMDEDKSSGINHLWALGWHAEISDAKVEAILIEQEIRRVGRVNSEYNSGLGWKGTDA